MMSKPGSEKQAWMAALNEELAKVYGEKEALRVSVTVLPGILGDFRRMLEASLPGTAVREEYRMEDGRITLYLEGRAEGAGKGKRLLITKVRTGNRLLAEDKAGVIVF